jgi:hypothetical protein
MQTSRQRVRGVFEVQNAAMPGNDRRRRCVDQQGAHGEDPADARKTRNLRDLVAKLFDLRVVQPPKSMGAGEHT